MASNYGAQIMVYWMPRCPNYFVYVRIVVKSVGLCKVKDMPHGSNL